MWFLFVTCRIKFSRSGRPGLNNKAILLNLSYVGMWLYMRFLFITCRIKFSGTGRCGLNNQAILSDLSDVGMWSRLRIFSGEVLTKNVVVVQRE